MRYQLLPKTTPDELERGVLELWEREDLFHRTMEATAGGKPFVFYEGPPTANGRPGIHHIFARTIKDLVNRYHAMLGESVTRIAGWDTHGLPVEIEIEKELNISGKSDIERYGVAEFNQKSRESVFRYKSDWESLSNRIGYWLDYDRPYVTYTNDYIESVWWLLQKLWSKGLLYEGHKVLPYCARCGTSLSSHELAMGYATHRSPSIYALFRLEDDAPDGMPRHLLVWTTTPWTLPSNVAVAVHPDLRYVELDVNGTRVIVERTIAQTKSIPGATGGEPLATFPLLDELAGRDLIGLRYRQLADAVDVDAQKAFVVVEGEFVTNDEGTGLVHMAPAFGADDYDTVRREGLAFVNPVGEDGRFVGTRWDAINGLTVFESNDVIAARLIEEKKVFGRYEPKGYEHTYPFCWRCDSPLLYYARRSWFVRTTAFRERMIEFNHGVNWSPPEVGSGRFGEWLENNVDWALSRDRYWGTPLPAWVCDADREHTIVIGSFAELADAAGVALTDDFDPHKPFIDEIVFKCRDCDGTMHRVPAVIDAWFDSGAMPFAQWHYPFENRDEFEAHFPADFICEGLDQTRGWFYSLLAIAAGVCDRPAYRNVIVNGLVLDPEGRKMSKRIGNVVDPWEAVREFGADAVRIYLLVSSQVWLPKRFDSKAISEVALAFLNRLRNTFNFLAQYAEDWTPGDDLPVAERPWVDRWLLTALDRVVERVHTAWGGYDVRGGTKAVMDFCDADLSNWYVRVNRGRFWAPDSSADPAALATLYETLVAVTRLLAPAAPFLSDAIHRRLTGESVHLARLPVAAAERDEALDVAMDAVRKLVSLARFARDDAGLKVRQPLSEMRVAVPAAVRGKRFDEFLGLLASEVNVGRVNVVESDGELVELRGKPNFRTLGKVYGAETPHAAKAASDLTSQQLRDLEAGETVSLQANGRSFTYRSEDVVVERDVKTDWLVRSDGPYVVALDPTLTAELKQEGIARELVNRVQRLRKEAGYQYTTRIVMSVSGAQEVLDALRSFRAYVAGETLAQKIDIGADLPDADRQETTEISGADVLVSLKQD